MITLIIIDHISKKKKGKNRKNTYQLRKHDNLNNM